MPFLATKKEPEIPTKKNQVNVRQAPNGISVFKTGEVANARREREAQRQLQRKAQQVYDRIPDINIPIPMVQPGPAPINTKRLEPGLIPGTAVTPNDPVSPLDCELWPNSPFCDPSQTIQPGPFLNVGIDVYAGQNETVILLTPSVGGLTFPPSAVSFRKQGFGGFNPYEVQPEPEPEPDEDGNPPEPLVVIEDDGPLDQNCWYWAIEVANLITSQPDNPPGPPFYLLGPVYSGSGSLSARATAYNGRLRDEDLYYFGHASETQVSWNPRKAEGAYIICLATGANLQKYYGYLNEGLWNAIEFTTRTSRFQNSLLCQPRTPIQPPPPTPPGRDPDMSCKCKREIDALGRAINSLGGLVEEISAELEQIYNAIGVETLPVDDPTDEGSYADLAALGAGVLGKFEKLEEAVGVEDFPMSLPNNIGKANSGNSEVKNLARAHAHLLKNLSATLGATAEIKVKVKDSDLTEEGDQEVEVAFPNLSEAIANLAGLALSNQVLATANLNASMRGLVQAGEATTISAVTEKQVQAIIEYLGFKLSRETEEIPLLYTPGETSPDKILQNKNVKIAYWDCDDDDILPKDLLTLKHAASIIRAAFFERLESSDQIADEVRNFNESINGEYTDFDSVLERMENGYLDADGNTESTPYGRPYNERPRIRKIGGQGGGANS